MKQDDSQSVHSKTLKTAEDDDHESPTSSYHPEQQQPSSVLQETDHQQEHQQQQQQQQQQPHVQQPPALNTMATESLEHIQNLQATRLSQLEAVLRRPDAVMEPTILENLRDYVMAQGDPQQAVELLTEHYVGYAQMASLACRWLRSVDATRSLRAETRTTNTITGRKNDHAAGEVTPPQPESLVAPDGNVGAGLGTLPRSDSVVQPLDAAEHNFERGGGGAAAAAAARSPLAMPFASDRGDHVNTAVPSTDEAYFLRSLVYEHFDPGRFAGVFESARHPAIGMINALITDADGRDLLYRLTLRHPDSLLLSFALAKILKEPGNDEEMAAALSAFIGPLEVFHKLLGARLRQAAEASDEATMQRLVREMVESARCGQHGYVYAQLLLHALASEREGDGSGAGRFQRMAQELEAAAPLPSRWKMQRWFVPGQAGEDAVAAAAAVGDVLSRASASSHVPISEVMKLQKLYYCCGKTNGDDDASTVPRGGEDGTAKHQRVGDCDGPRAPSGTQTQTPPTTPHHSPPPLTIIRHPELLKALLAALFAPGKQLKPEVLSAHVDVIAAAVAGTTREGQDPPTPAAGSLALQPAVGAVREALATAAELAHKVAGERVLSRDEVVRLEGAVSERIAAAGVLSMLRSMLTSQEYWTTTYHIHKEPPFLPLLTAIVERQPSMQDDVLSLIVDALAAMGSSAGGPDTARALLGVAAKLAHVGHVEPVLSWIERWARTADTGLVRHFAFKLLEGAAPPYSPWFAATVLRLAAAGGVKRQRIGAKEWTARSPLLAEFAEGCASVEFDPPLGWEEAACLRDLRTSLSV